MHPPDLSPGPALRPGILFLDVESSGLHAGAFPVEVGICDDGLVPRSWLIKPEPGWDRSRWSLAAENIHGLSLERLMDEGSPAVEVAMALADVTTGKSVHSDAPDHDGRWLRELSLATGVTLPDRLSHEVDAYAFLAAASQAEALAIVGRWRHTSEVVDLVYPHAHRAGPDAAAMAARFRMTLDPVFAGRVEALSGRASR